jgi:hypothetical protein
MQRLFRRLNARWQLALQSDTHFIETAFREILGRSPDLDGLTHYRRVLREGLGRTAVLLDIMRSEEFTAKLKEHSSSLPSLRVKRPERYREATDRTNGQAITLFEVASASDFDWLEAAILRHGYYEKPGVWNLRIDADKRVVAEIVASFQPQRPLEVGCAAGAVIECLEEYNIVAEGVEISALGVGRASARIRDRIHHGDLLSLDLAPQYDFVFGLDVFEHLNPNRLDHYLARLVEITKADACLLCNIPAFGTDPIFGTVFPFYVDGWEEDATAGRPFSTLHVDTLGYPIHGHLIWADARWWIEKFQSFGFQREADIERALHGKYDGYMEKHSPARKSYFVFAKPGFAHRRAAVTRLISHSDSRVLHPSSF